MRTTQFSKGLVIFILYLLAGPGAGPVQSQGPGGLAGDSALERKVPPTQVKVGPPQWKTGAPLQANKASAPATVNVKDLFFGAKGDGMHDDTAAIQSAVDHVFARGGAPSSSPPALTSLPPYI